MSASDIIKAREGLENNISAGMSKFDIAEARESLAAFERLVAEPACTAPALTVRAHIAAQVAGNLAHSYEGDRFSLIGSDVREEIADKSVQLADALIERLNRK